MNGHTQTSRRSLRGRLSSERGRTTVGMLAAFGLTAVIWTAALAVFGFYPFGGKSILITDLNQQYVEFHAALYDMVKSGSSLLFTWDTGLGMNFLGLLAYYLASPFTLLLFCFPRAMLTEAILFIISMKLAASALTFSLWLRKRHGIGGGVNLLFAALYGLAGYGVTYCFNLMWLDGMVLLPLVALAARRVFDKGRIGAFTAALTVLFLANFYIAYVVGIFTFLLYLGWLLACREDRRPVRRLGAFFAGTALAAGLATFLLLPTLSALLGGYENVHGFSLTFQAGANPLALLGKMGWGAFDSATNSGTPTLYGGVLTMGLLPLWFTHRSIPRREKYVVGALLAVMLLSLLLYDLDLAWHVFQPPNWFPYRYTFVILFLLITCAARVLACPADIRPAAIPISFGALALATLLGGASGQIPYAGNWWATALMLGGYGLITFLVWHARRRELQAAEASRPAILWPRRALAALLVAAVSVELLFNATAILNGLDDQFRFVERQNYTDYTARNAQLTALLDAQNDSGFYRVENSTARNSNDGMNAGYHALSHYSSLSNQIAFKFLGNLGMVCYVQNRYLRYMGSTSALDAVLGIRYVWDTEELRPGMVSTGASYGDTTLFRNENALPLLYFADQAAAELNPGGADPFTLQNRFFSSLNGRETTYYSSLPVTVTCTDGDPEANGGSVTVPAGSNLYFTIENPVKQHVLLHLNNNLNEHSPVYVDGKKLNVYDDRLIRGVIDLGMQEAGTVIVKVPVWYKGWYSDVRAAGFDEEAFSGFIDELRQTAVQDLSVTDTTVTGTIQAPRDGLVFTSIPYDKGWRAVIDGKTVEPVKVGDAFLAYPVAAGEHQVSLRFIPYGLVPGAVVSGLTLAGLLAVCIWRRARKRER